jgi:type II secretory pathway pseudopilin PulG
MSLGLTAMLKKTIAPRVALALLRNLTPKSNLNPSKTESGLTLIEGLIAIMVISITVIAITPPILWATATRVQNRRAEQALQIAQGEIDRVRTLVERGVSTASLSQLPPAAGENIRGNPSPVNAPTVDSNIVTSSRSLCAREPAPAATPSSRPTSPTAYIKVDTDTQLDTLNNCEPEFLLQTFRSTGLDIDGKTQAEYLASRPSGSTVPFLPVAFVMGVRVYSNVSRVEGSLSTASVEQASLQGTTGLGQQRFRPLAVLYTTIVPSNTSKNLDIYRKLCPGSSTGGSVAC